MIELYCQTDGRSYWVKPEDVSWIASTSDADAYHGRRSTVKLSDGTVLQCSQKPAAVAELIRAARGVA